MKRDKTLIRVTGLVKSEYAISIDHLVEMDKVQVKDVLFACGSGEPKGHLEECVGVLLKDLINDAEIETFEHNDTKKMFVIVAAADGYKTVFSWQELFNTEVGEGVMVLLEKEGERLYESMGAVDLFSAKDFLTGPRYVKKVNLVTIVKVD